MNKLIVGFLLAFSLVISSEIMFEVGAKAGLRAQSAAECELDRAGFELLVGLRLTNYASTDDSWAQRAGEWSMEIQENLRAGQVTPSLDGAFSRFQRYCGQDDPFMAGLTLGEFIGLGL
jgi:hypothetical protein